MFVSECLGVNERGAMTIGGMDVADLARRYGTPLMIMDENMIRRMCGMYRDALRCHWGGESLVAYASKAFCTGYMFKILAEESLGADVVSGGEMYTARAAGFGMGNTFFHGNSKPEEEHRQALECGVGRIVVDNIEELELLSRIAREMGKKPSIMIRVKPGINAQTHNYVLTGNLDSKFGFAIETGEALEAVRHAVACPDLDFTGIHCHLGSQIFESAPYIEAARVMCGFAREVLDTTGAACREINVGGGFGVRYIDSHEPKTIDEFIRDLSAAMKTAIRECGIPTPKLIIEPGRSIVAASGITVYKIASVKRIPGVRTYVTIDGGMTDNPRFALYEAVYDFELPERVTEPKDTLVTVGGRCCESGDILGRDVPIQTPHPGEYICTLVTGAFNYSMASNYNRVGRPALLMVRDGVEKVVIRRETYEDMVRLDVF